MCLAEISFNKFIHVISHEKYNNIKKIVNKALFL